MSSLNEGNLVGSFLSKINEVNAQVTSTVKAVEDVQKAAKLDDFKKLSGWMRTGFKIYTTLEKLKLIKSPIPDLFENWTETAKQVVEVIKKGLDWWGFSELDTFDPLNKAQADQHAKKASFFFFFENIY